METFAVSLPKSPSLARPDETRFGKGCILFGVPLLWSAVAERSCDTAFDFTEALKISEAAEITSHQSGVAPVFTLPSLSFSSLVRGLRALVAQKIEDSAQFRNFVHDKRTSHSDGF